MLKPQGHERFAAPGDPPRRDSTGRCRSIFFGLAGRLPESLGGPHQRSSENDRFWSALEATPDRAAPPQFRSTGSDDRNVLHSKSLCTAGLATFDRQQIGHHLGSGGSAVGSAGTVQLWREPRGVLMRRGAAPSLASGDP
jgi:hypothetical protein